MLVRRKSARGTSTGFGEMEEKKSAKDLRQCEQNGGVGICLLQRQGACADGSGRFVRRLNTLDIKRRKFSSCIFGASAAAN
jgi:hypothetical protein